MPLMERELAVLPGLAPRLPLPVPVPELVGQPADGYPWPFWGARLVPGVELADAGLPDDGRDAAGRPGRRLPARRCTTRRSPGTSAAPSPTTRCAAARRAPGGRWRATALDRLAGARHLGRRQRPGPRRSTGSSPPRTRCRRPAGEPVLVHGDLHLRHLLVGAGRAGHRRHRLGRLLPRRPGAGPVAGLRRLQRLGARRAAVGVRPAGRRGARAARPAAGPGAVRGAGRLRRPGGLPGAAGRVARRPRPRRRPDAAAQATSTGASSPRSCGANWVR